MKDMKKKIIVKHQIPCYYYMEFITKAIRDGVAFKYREVNQLGARLSGKTTSDNIELVRAIIAAAKAKRSLFILILRMRYNKIGDAWNDIVKVLREYKLPYKIWKGRWLIRIWTTKIQIKGCYTENSTEVSFLGFGIQKADYGVIVFEEARQFDEKTVNAILVAVRGIKHQVEIYRSNPYLLNTWFSQKCYKQVMYSEDTLRNGSGSQFSEVGDTIYHYMRYDVNPFNNLSNIAYLERIKRDLPSLANTEVYGLPGTSSGMVFAGIMGKVKTTFVDQSWRNFTAGIDVGHVSSATAGSFWAVSKEELYKLGEYYHSNKTMRFKESEELAKDLVGFYEGFRKKYNFNRLDVYVDSSDPGFYSQLNTVARKIQAYWFLAIPCTKIPISHRISITVQLLTQGRYHISKNCVKTLEEYKMIAYDEKAEDNKPKLVKQDDHTWDSDMYALTPHMSDFLDWGIS